MAPMLRVASFFLLGLSFSFAETLPDVLDVSDLGLRQRFEISRTEAQRTRVSDGMPEVVTFASRANAKAAAGHLKTLERTTGQRHDLVLYEAGKPRTIENRRVVTRQVVAKLGDGVNFDTLKTATSALKATLPSFAPGYAIFDFDSGEAALAAAALLPTVPGVLEAEAVLARQHFGLSFYGMKALLLLYLTKYHLFADGAGYDLIGAYGGLVYCIPVIGGLLADRWLGMRKAVVFGGLLLVAGHAGMALEGVAAVSDGGVVTRDEGALRKMYLSLALIVMGVGFLKPNIAGIVGRLYPLGDPRRDGGFSLFYAGINLGALLASLVCGYLGETLGWRYGFGAAGIGMLLGLAMFLWGQRYLQGHVLR